ncbi:MAG: exodeoxyribonuclease VII large subunit [Clostridia bacterium]|nr:exodeoxyribonuclease VII large subunit [Clostridia bacterium]
MTQSALSVKQLNFYVKNLIEGDPRLSNICVLGEISNLKNHYSSGHIYFTLKDNDATVSCVMFRSFASRLRFDLENGMQVAVRGRVSVYEKDGQYRIYAEDITDAGLGDIARRFEQVKAKLEKEGLFDPDSKRPLPKFPKKIAVVTSRSGAAVRDILNILSRRWPVAEVLMCPVSVQGDFAVPEMLEALDRLYTLEGIDLCIIGRGGGSAEDLWAFNDEKLAYKIYEAPFPVISAVGHETDFTISDFVADLRAPTPSAAAELAVPDMAEILSQLGAYKDRLSNLLRLKFENCKLRLERVSLDKDTAVEFLSAKAEIIDRLSDKLSVALKEKINTCKLVFSEKAGKLDALSPLKTMARGFVVASQDKKVLQSVKELKHNDLIDIRFTDGTVKAEVKEIKVK